MKKLLVRAAIAVAALVAAVVLAEATVRVLDPFGVSYYRDVNRYQHHAIKLTSANPLAPDDGERLFQNLPRVDLELRTFRFSTDDVGLRVAEPGGLPDGEGLRVLCLGDSSTLGWGVEDYDTWVRVLEREGRAPDGRGLVCMNAGHLMYDTAQESDWLEHNGPMLQPEVVLLMFNNNDLNPTLEVYHSLVDAMMSVQPPEGFERVTAGAERLLISSLHGLRNLLRYRDEVHTLGRAERHDFSIADIANYPEGWPRVARYLEEIRATCEANGWVFVVLDHADPGVPDLAPWCEERGVMLVDVTWTDEEWKLDIRNSAADPHANELGNRLIAEKALAGLRELGVLR